MNLWIMYCFMDHPDSVKQRWLLLLPMKWKFNLDPLQAQQSKELEILLQYYHRLSQETSFLLMRYIACQELLKRFYIQLWKISRSEEHTSELQSRGHLVCRLLLEKKK